LIVVYFNKTNSENFI